MVHLLLTDEPSSPCGSSSSVDRRVDSNFTSPTVHDCTQNSNGANEATPPSAAAAASEGATGSLRISTESTNIYNNLERVTPRSTVKQPQHSRNASSNSIAKCSSEKVNTQCDEESHNVSSSQEIIPPSTQCTSPPSYNCSNNLNQVDNGGNGIVDASMYHLYQNTTPHIPHVSSSNQCINENILSPSSISSSYPPAVPLTVTCAMTTLQFLPLCDLLFNIISLTGYFCDIVFDLVTIYSVYTSNEDHEYQWFVPMLLLVLCSSLISQYLSFKWYIRWKINDDGSVIGVTGEAVATQHDTSRSSAGGGGGGELVPHEVNHSVTCKSVDHSTDHTVSSSPVSSWFILILINNWIPSLYNIIILTVHVLQLGVLWRYFRLFVPVNLHTVKYEVRDLCMLRMVHAFCEAAPMLLIQVSDAFSSTALSH